MAYDLTDDTLHDDPIWETLTRGRRDRVAFRDALQSSYMRIRCAAAKHKTNGFLTEETALRWVTRPEVLDALCTATLDRAPLVHKAGDECRVCDKYGAWVDGYDYRIHAFLKKNPSKAEQDRRKDHDADLKDERLKLLVRERDGHCCRYCRSGPLTKYAGAAKDRRKQLTYDHVDPDRAAGPDGENLVLACERCQKEKGQRTPDEADMLMYPAPSDVEATAWGERGRKLFDRPDFEANRLCDRWWIDHETTIESTSTLDPQSTPDLDSPSIEHIDSDERSNADSALVTGHDQASANRDDVGNEAWSYPASGLVGGSAVPGMRPAPDTPRQGGDRDIYTGRSRVPAQPASPELHDTLTSAQSLVLSALSETPRLLYHIATRTHLDIKQAEKALSQLADLGHAVRIIRGTGVPVQWRRATP